MFDQKTEGAFQDIFGGIQDDIKRVADWWEKKCGEEGPYCMWYEYQGERQYKYRSTVKECILAAMGAHEFFTMNSITEVESHGQFFRRHYK